MELKEAIRKRRSVRHFSDKKPSNEVIDELIEYAHLAPSAGNLQARDFIVVDDERIKDKLSTAALNQQFVSDAPVVIVVCANTKRAHPYGRRGEELYCVQDASAAVEHILLMAVEHGLVSCWVGAFDEKRTAELFKLPSWVRPVAILPIGYADEMPSSPSRKDSRMLTHKNKW